VDLIFTTKSILAQLDSTSSSITGGSDIQSQLRHQKQLKRCEASEAEKGVTQKKAKAIYHV
jgi:hypothetical protein